MHTPLCDENRVPGHLALVDEAVAVLDEAALLPEGADAGHADQRLVEVGVERRFADRVDSFHLPHRRDVDPLCANETVNDEFSQ